MKMLISFLKADFIKSHMLHHHKQIPMLNTPSLDKWLGEILHENGLASVHATLLDREGKVKGAIREAIAIMEDFRMQKIGGLLGGIDRWEVAIIPSLLNNAETWVEINETCLQLLEELQNSFIRKLFRTKKTAPKLALAFEIMMRKLIFVNDLKLMDKEMLAHQVYSEQMKYGFPGLASYCILNLEDASVRSG